MKQLLRRVWAFLGREPILFDSRVPRDIHDPEWVQTFFDGADTAALRLAQATIEKIIWDRYWNS